MLQMLLFDLIGYPILFCILIWGAMSHPRKHIMLIADFTVAGLVIAYAGERLNAYPVQLIFAAALGMVFMWEVQRSR